MPDFATYRLLLAIAATAYLSWWGVVALTLPDAYNPLGSRVAVCGALALAAVASRLVPSVARALPWLFAGGFALVTLHYFWLLDANRGELPWVAGAFVLVVSTQACLFTAAQLVTYAALALPLAAVVAVRWPHLRVVFLPGMLTLFAVSYAALRARMRLEGEARESADRARRSEQERARAETAVRERDRVLSVSGHELRSPVAALLLQLEGLRRHAARTDEHSARTLDERFERAYRQAERVAALVEDLLAAGRFAPGGVPARLEAIDLGAVAREVVDGLAESLADAGCAVTVRCDAAVVGQWDRSRIAQVITNLVGNAMKYGAGCPVSVEVTRAGDRARLIVADRGVGVALEDRERIFERFDRGAHHRDERFAGVGLGLWIVREIVASAGGVVCCEPVDGDGARFVVDLPLAAPAA